MTGQADVWPDPCGNLRASLHLCISPLAIIDIDKEGEVRCSSTVTGQIVVQFGMSAEMTDPDTVLAGYVCKRIKKACPHFKNKAARMSYLHATARFMALCRNLMKLLGDRTEFIYEFRIRFYDDSGKPFAISKQLVQYSRLKIISTKAA
jgi:hypothetical protein